MNKLLHFVSSCWTKLPGHLRGQKSNHIERGVLGENLACRFLRRNGYKVLYRNFRGRSGGEIDIVCRDHDTLVFVEVKSRGSEAFGRPFEAIRPDQRNRISRGAVAWLRLLDNPDISFRFDVIEVLIDSNQAGPHSTKPRIELIRDAFPLPQSYLY